MLGTPPFTRSVLLVVSPRLPPNTNIWIIETRIISGKSPWTTDWRCLIWLMQPINFFVQAVHVPSPPL